ncbi:PRC-barrel domain-containing protein [Sphingomonas turrisvirgatae]|uniref:Photosystem reaction center subunit H n=1 Tax=Sphingomonas turrisvirgatae TaxID=1888892 RepID=A0A1E3LX21_9SPHN|nr:PRC-barrel domain-containing protein [Sphingomonas turrisvirgatae]ODP38269.1 photosystem reaction center subunit H [Sphingomonas turrisvirgatae]
MNARVESPNPMIASDRVEGTAVYSRMGERLGTVERFMVDKVSGQVEYAVLAFGGVLGIGHRHYPLPWRALTYEPEQGGYVVDITREQIDSAPGYDAEGDDEPSYDRAYREQLAAYYTIPPV